MSNLFSEQELIELSAEIEVQLREVHQLQSIAPQKPR
jgi:hypothetical protein